MNYLIWIYIVGCVIAGAIAIKYEYSDYKNGHNIKVEDVVNIVLIVIFSWVAITIDLWIRVKDVVLIDERKKK